MTDRGNIINCPNCKRLFSTPQGLGMHLKHGCSLSDKKSFALGKQPDREQLCREFTELTGGHWHDPTWVNPNGIKFSGLYQCSCGIKSHFSDSSALVNPTYENPADVLRVMMARDDWYILDWAKPSGFVWNIGEPILCDQYAVGYNINSKYIIEPDALLKAAVEWLKAKAARRENNA